MFTAIALTAITTDINNSGISYHKAIRAIAVLEVGL
jgi:hypothetical protein